MEASEREAGIRKVFLIGVVLKAFNALLELVLGILLMYTNVVSTLILDLANSELVEDPNDFISSHLQALAHPSPGAQLFAALYMLSHGAVKIVLAYGLWFNKIWAYPASMAVLILFILYQLARIIQTYSIPLILLTIFDLVFLWLVYHEYKQMQKSAIVS